MAEKTLNLTLLRNYSLCIWEIRYWLPDSPHILGPEFTVQEYDLPPSFPELHRFLKFWSKNIEGKLHSVKVASHALIRPAEFRIIGTEIRLH